MVTQLLVGRQLISEGVDLDVFEETEGGTAGKYAGSSVPLEDVTVAPEGFPIKGNESSMIYHVPGGGSYDATIAEFYFKTAEDAEAAGFTRAGGGSAEEDDK